jgi:hypothetical protein
MLPFPSPSPRPKGPVFDVTGSCVVYVLFGSLMAPNNNNSINEKTQISEQTLVLGLLWSSTPSWDYSQFRVGS